MHSLRYCFIFLAFAGIILSSCKKDEEENPPVLTLKSEITYTTDGVYLQNHIAKFGIIAEGKSANITNLTIKCKSKQGEKTILDEGHNIQQLNITKVIQNAWGDSLIWTISVMDKNRHRVSLSLKTYDTTVSYSPIHSFENIVLGMQSNTQYGSFLNPFIPTVYTTTNAALNQANVDILMYYYVTSGTPSYTFSSAGDYDAPIYFPSLTSWTTKNYTDWDYATQVPVSAFDQAINDSLLSAAFHSGSGISSRKYKYAAAGQVIPFKTSSGKKGLIKVKEVNAQQENGWVKFDLKIQQ